MWWVDRRMAEWRCSNINITKRTASVVCKWVLTEQFCVCLKFSVTKYCKGEGAGGDNRQIQSYKNGRAAALGLRPSSNVKELQTCPQGNAEGSTPGLTPDWLQGSRRVGTTAPAHHAPGPQYPGQRTVPGFYAQKRHRECLLCMYGKGKGPTPFNRLSHLRPLGK